MPKWKKGQSGNPAGRPKGSRDRINKEFVEALAKDFVEHGAETIVRLREADPRAYLQLAAQLVPKESAVKVNVHSEAQTAFIEAMKAIQLKPVIIEGNHTEVEEVPKLPDKSKDD